MGSNVSGLPDRKISFDVNFQRGRRIFAFDDQNSTPRALTSRRATVAVTDPTNNNHLRNGETALSCEGQIKIHRRRGTLTTTDQPKPTPRISKKKEFLKDVNFEDMDYIASQAPLDLLTKTMWHVVEYLVITPSGKEIDNLLKIRAIYRWLTSYDVYSIDSEIIPPTDSPLEHMLKIQCDLTSHAQMVYMLCMLADIPCVIVNGITKGGSYEVGSEMKYEELASQWNAVYINGQWRFIDVFWSSTCVHGSNDDNTIFVDANGKITRKRDIDESVKYNEFYFFTDPDEFIYTHLPDEDDWQLLPVPITLSKFEKMPYLREYFHLYEMSILDKCNKVNHLVAEKETVNIIFGLPYDRSHNYMFKFMLSQKRTQIESNKPVDILLERFVAIIHWKDKVTFKVRLPFYGKYQFDVYGCDFSKRNTFSLLCTYKINCIDPKEQCLPFPDCPEVGFGNNPHSEKLNVFSETPMSPFVRTQNGIVEFFVRVDKGTELSHSLKSLLIDSGSMSRHILSRREGNMYITNVKLPREGEYVIKFYLGQTQDDIPYHLPPDILNFVIKFKGEERPSNLPFPNIPEGQLGVKLDAISLGVKCLSKCGNYIKACDGKANIQFQADKSITLLCETSCCKREGNSRVSVDTKVTDDIWNFDVDMPIPGEYSMNLFAFKNKDNSKLYQIHSFFIHSEGNVTRRVRFYDDCVIENLISDTIVTSDDHIVIPIPPLTDYEKLFTTFRKTDEKFYECENNVKIKTNHDNIELNLNDYGEYVLEIFVQDEYDNTIGTVGRFYIHRKKDEDIFEDDFQELVNTLKPPDEEEPVEEPLPDRLDSVFEPSQFEEIGSEDSDSDNGNDDNEDEFDEEEDDENDRNSVFIQNEETKSLALTEDSKSIALTENTDAQPEDGMDEETKEKVKEAKEKTIKKSMATALKSKDLPQMKKELKRFKQLNMDPEDKMVAYIEKVVKELTAKGDMAEACSQRNPEKLQKCINQAKEANFDHHLDMQIELSLKVLNRVKEIERLSKPLLKMNQNILTEMKKYQTPPDGVHQVLRATCMLLGDDPKKLKSWKTCQGILFKTGKEHLMRRISQFDITSTTPEIVKKIRSILYPYCLAQLRDVSKGAAAFFLWVTGILKEIDKRQKVLHKTNSLRSALPRPAIMSDYHQNKVLRI